MRKFAIGYTGYNCNMKSSFRSEYQLEAENEQEARNKLPKILSEVKRFRICKVIEIA